VYFNVLQCSKCDSVRQCAVVCTTAPEGSLKDSASKLCVAVCGVQSCAAVCCSVFGSSKDFASKSSVSMCCSVQCVAACCGVRRCVAACTTATEGS